MTLNHHLFIINIYCVIISCSGIDVSCYPLKKEMQEHTLVDCALDVITRRGLMCDRKVYGDRAYTKMHITSPSCKQTWVVWRPQGNQWRYAHTNHAHIVVTAFTDMFVSPKMSCGMWKRQMVRLDAPVRPALPLKWYNFYAVSAYC